ncbi:response regulator [Geovibrio thiophilus]|uniref:Response regulator n=1 Tax=Geovibrio thiophilus TaxID=139438 RepID=A0A410JVE8_9BACT|nr:response regulator [Geovibrio thiophilus]QAR32011.1 response regulator [Geovibrio thiophilus]
MKRNFFILNFITAFILVSAASAFILHKADISVRRIINEQRKTVRAQIGDKLKSFDLFMLVMADRMEERAGQALREIDAVLGESAAKGIPADPETLRRLADEKGVGEIYLINSNGVVFSTSNRREQGVSLTKAGKSLADFINSLYGTGTFSHGRLSVGMVTGRPAMFSYYSPKGSSYITETAVYLEDFISESHGRNVYEYYFRDYFSELVNSCAYTRNIDVFTKFSVSGYSLFNFRREFPLEPSSADRLKNGEMIEKRDGGRLYEYSAFRLKNSEGDFAETYYLEVVYDFSGVGDSVMRSAYAAIFSVFLSGVLLFFMLNCLTSKKKCAESGNADSGLSPIPGSEPQTADGGSGLFQPQAGHKGYRILLADDSEYNRFVTESYIEGSGCVLDYADSGFAALELFSKNRYDMVLTDIQMPKMNGYELTKEIRALEESTGMKRTPVIAITAYDLERERRARE